MAIRYILLDSLGMDRVTFAFPKTETSILQSRKSQT
jgi:hypothetical protein